uniref:Uncharacterized protein n=1 Tax=Octopus bimaculoides TaxID=37653 RepID=A0A0L8G8P1_OCTBM
MCFLWRDVWCRHVEKRDFKGTLTQEYIRHCFPPPDP